MRSTDGNWGTFQPCVVRGADEERLAARRRVAWTVGAGIVAAVALLALAAQSPGDAPAPSLAAKTSKLWSHDGENGDSSTQAVAVNEDDISNLGLRAPSGFNVPSVNVTADDIARLGLVAPSGFRMRGVNVSEEDIERLGLRAPNGAEIPEMEVTEDDIERFGLTAPTADAGSAAGTVTVTPEDVERYGLVAPQGISARLNITVTQQDIARLGLTNPSISEDEARALGIFGDGPEVSDEDINTYGMHIAAPTPEEAASLGLSNATIRISAAQAASLGLSGPVSLTPEEAHSLGLSQAATGAMVTEDDIDRLGLRDPVGWNATGFSHLSTSERRQVLVQLRRKILSRAIQQKAAAAVEQLVRQKMHAHVARKRAAAHSEAAKKR